MRIKTIIISIFSILLYNYSSNTNSFGKKILLQISQRIFYLKKASLITELKKAI
jgi:hypothetical protein